MSTISFDEVSNHVYEKINTEGPKKMVQIDFAAQYFNSNSIPVSGYTWESRNQKDSGILSDISI